MKFEDDKTNNSAALENIMETWIYQKGHPIVHIQIINESSISIRQERFLFESATNLNSERFENSA